MAAHATREKISDPTSDPARSRRNRQIAYAITALCFIAAVLYHSRAFIVGYTAAFLFIFATKKGLSKKKKWLITGCILSACIGGLAFFVKQESSTGRLLIYKISLSVVGKNFPWGVGLGNFQKAYLPCQEEYFRNGAYSTSELLLADNISHAYNDYWQLIIEWGIAGIGVLAAIAILLRWLLNWNRRRAPNIPRLIAAAQLAALLTAAFFTYVFDQFLFQAVALTSLLILLPVGRKPPAMPFTDPLVKPLLSLLLLSALAWAHYGKLIVLRSSYRQAAEAHDLLQAGFTGESIRSYQQLYPVLQDDPWFLNSYAAALYTSRDYSKAIQLLTRMNRGGPSSVYLERIGDCYVKTGDNAGAEKAYLSAMYMVPNRFTPRWALFDLYLSTGQTLKAASMGRSILTLPVKIPSPRIDRIKEDVRVRMPSS